MKSPLLSIKNATFFVTIFRNKGRTILGKIFPGKGDLFHLKRLAVQVRKKPGIGGEPEGQAVGVQGLIAPVLSLFQLAILPVAQEGMACVSKLGADLMGPSGYQLALHQGQAVSGLKRPVVGQGGFGAWLRLCCDVDPVLDGILENLPTQGPWGGIMVP